jgi:hypothetical protein
MRTSGEVRQAELDAKARQLVRVRGREDVVAVDLG